MRNLLLLSILLTSLNYGYGQNAPDNLHVLKKNRFNIGLRTGLLPPTDFNVALGDQAPQGLIGGVFEGNLKYTFVFKKYWGISLSAATGGHSFRYSLKDQLAIGAPSLVPLGNFTSFHNYASLGLNADYNYWLTPRWMLNGSLGMNWRFEASVGAGSQGQFEQVFWSVSHYYPNRGRGYLNAATGINYLLKNDNFIGIDLGFQYGLKQYYQGFYQVSVLGQISEGLHQSAGHYPYINFSYTMTGSKKRKELDDLFFNDSLTYDQAIKKSKSERRYIDPKSVFIGGFGGGFWTFNQLERPMDALRNGYAASFSGQLSAEIGLTGNRYLQLIGSFQEYSELLKMAYDGISFHGSGNIFSGIHLGVGIGQRIITKSNWNPININAGVMVGTTTFSVVGLKMPNSIDISNGQQEEWMTLTREYQEVNNILPSFYIGLNKDFRLFNDLYFAVDYRYNLGWNTAYKTNIEVTYAPEHNESHYNSILVNGTGFSLQFGLKYKFVPAK